MKYSLDFSPPVPYWPVFLNGAWLTLKMTAVAVVVGVAVGTLVAFAKRSKIKPLSRGSGFKFEDRITGGVVPRNYIPAVEEGVLDALKHGPLGFPVVDLSVALIDGSYHTVDSSDQAFRTAGRIGIVEGLPQSQPVLLEPIHEVEIVCPSEATAKMNAILSGRRGQILGFDTREGWDGWDTVRAQMPESEIGDLIIEVRSATAGVGSFIFKFDHMAELTGRTADQIIAARRAAE